LFPGVMRELELRAGRAEEVSGKLIAVWRRSIIKVRRGFWSRRGWMENGEGKKWELMVPLMGLAIIEAAARRNK
jgi:hypothetical protein